MKIKKNLVIKYCEFGQMVVIGGGGISSIIHRKKTPQISWKDFFCQTVIAKHKFRQRITKENANFAKESLGQKFSLKFQLIFFL